MTLLTTDQLVQFRDALANAISVLPVGVKNHPGVLMQSYGGTLYVSATDGYVYVVTEVFLPVKMDHTAFVDKAAAKAMLGSEEPLKDFASLPEVGEEVQERQNLEALYAMASDPGSDTEANALTYAADRVKKLGSLKPAGLPLLVIPARDAGVWYARFVYGEQTYGVFTLLDLP